MILETISHLAHMSALMHIGALVVPTKSGIDHTSLGKWAWGKARPHASLRLDSRFRGQLPCLLVSYGLSPEGSRPQGGNDVIE